MIPPGGAACCKRLATLTVSPMAVYSPVVPTFPNKTGPEWIPTRIETIEARSASTGSAPREDPERLLRLVCSRAACISKAARTACAASSSCETCPPHTAMTASPICLSICPPRRKMAWSRRCHKAFIVSRTSSASMCSAIAVKPTTSANNIVTSLRRSSIGNISSRGRGETGSAELTVSNAASFWRAAATNVSTVLSPNTLR